MIGLARDCVSIEWQETKKPTYVGFFVEQNTA